MKHHRLTVSLRLAGLAGLLACTLGSALAQEAVIRKNLADRLPTLSKIDEVSKTPMNGLYEIRVNETDIFYTDAEGNFLIQGNLIDTRAKRNLTEERAEKLNAIDFDALPLKDAFTQVRGNGKRKLAVFEDPNCGYCKRFERDLQKVDDVTIHTFLIPILSADSVEKSKNIWCSKDKNKAWLDWMVRDQPAAKASCDTSALERNLAFSKKYKITGTPTVFFANGTRVPGAISAQEIEKQLASAAGK
ncbi:MULTISPECIES: DsbC family protein [unclassified Polaromonas]|uniref:DsbC family protein n=1 Tax=unclassified Polaromonas TaxID=2638319 RepID=UPI0018CAB5DC|nr:MULTISPECIES: DsbC family protein [unclassified Polaromonas]MBG6070946.1 thiol:disulfide interchange protein DsbC [Polaromonas sp. CG_9.7]MBG6112744.1 thiol:disulfide interchange protein DsbC [Polaromonas sp. CG_9.2]MDH6186219.1 thiol:disulfide interchange protein DsbC [Polaromonas sp. CG_23.6]